MFHSGSSTQNQVEETSDFTITPWDVERAKNKKWKIAREPQAKQDHINKEIGNHQQVKNIYKNSSYRQMPCDQTFIMT